MNGRRRGIAAAALLLCAALLWVGQRRAVAAAALVAPRIGDPMLLLGMQALAGLLVACALWQLRWLLARAGATAVRVVDDAEERLFSKLPQRTARWTRALAVACLVAIGTLLSVEVTPVEQGLESGFVDRWFSLRFPLRSLAELATSASQASRRNEIVVVDIDDDTVARLGWPLPRLYYARLIDTISAAGAASLAVDVSLFEPSDLHPEWDQAIGEAAARAGNVFFTYALAAPAHDDPSRPSVAALKVMAANTIPLAASSPVLRGLVDFSELAARVLVPKLVIDPVAQRSRGVAMANVVDDGDGVLRHFVPVARLDEQLYPSLSLRMAAFALQVPLAEIRIYPGSHLSLGGKRWVPIDTLGRTLIRYQGRSSATGDGPFRYVSMWSLLRSDVALTLAQNPNGADQEFVINDKTRMAGSAVANPLGLADLSGLQPGTVVSGLLDYASDPGHIDELSLDPQPAAEAPHFEPFDETRMRFQTRVVKLRRIGQSAALLGGKHVLLGSTALAASDVHQSPVGAIPGVEYHATMLSNLLHGDFFVTAPLWTRVVLTLLVAVLAALSGSLASPGGGLLLAVLLLCGLVLGTFLPFGAGVHVPFVAPATAMMLSYGLCVLVGFRAERRARAHAEQGREFVRRTFGRYLTDQVVQEILDSPDGLRFGGQRRFVTLMMTDLRGFTSTCGVMEPENVVTLLNHYLEAMTRIIIRHGGIIDEFIGDAILVVFGAPIKHGDDEARAMVCAIEMQNEMADVNRWNQERGLPAVEMGIGVHSGEVVLGNIGSELRAKYGIVGSTINLTSRVESCTVGGQVLCSEATQKRCQVPLLLGSSQSLKPKGVRTALTVHEVLGVGAPYHVELRAEREIPDPPTRPLRVRYALVVDKQVGAFIAEGVVEMLSELGLFLRTEQSLEVLANLRLQLLDASGAPLPGELYGKVLPSRSNASTGVVYVRLTSVAQELRRVLAEAHGGAAATSSVLDAPIVSGDEVR